ncbi:trypsin alpha-3 [Zeugodacus cucurbitae]|nr:trypsin alpha-3 [Zeugodacus cucurbitae]
MSLSFLLIAIFTLLNINQIDGQNTLNFDTQSGLDTWNADSLLSMKIIGGTKAKFASTPYQVSVRLNGYHFCGGSIIANDVVLTAAHCIFKDQLNNYQVQYGVDNVGKTANIVKIAKITTHEKFNKDTIDYDVAVIKLTAPIRLGVWAKIIPLAKANPPAGANAVVVGWGQTDENGPTVQQLQSINVKIVAPKVCSQKYKKIDKITDRMICAGVSGGGKGTCGGDSGGPLAVNGQQVGIVSWGVGCAHPDFPGVYSSVAKLRSWITAHMK